MTFLCTATGAAAQTVGPAPDEPIEHLRDLSLEDLSQMEVTSVSKAPMALSAAPAAIYVITQSDIRRSGATTIPEMLRLAPNLEVFRNSASNYVITARGFSGNSGAQSFSNKLLVLIDGRSVYTPLFSGVYWDMQQVLPENIERIEVISGPGATLWGANAVNGVINIITRGASETQGVSATIDAGTRQTAASLQYGGHIGADVSYRAYLQGFWDGDTELADGSDAHDSWSRPQGGFRLDWTPAGRNAFTVQGDAYAGSENRLGAADEDIAGRDLLGRWTRTGRDGSELRVQGYYDYTERHTLDGGGRLQLNTYDLDVQHSFSAGDRNDFVWGGGVRFEDYKIDGTSGLNFSPSARTLTLANLFAQDTIRLTESARVTLGLKAEDDPYSGLAWLPSVRLSWTPVQNVLLWGAVSRAVRSPTPFDTDVRESIGPTLFLTGDPRFETEKLTAYELGLRFRPSTRSSLSVSAFYNDYDDLRSIELDPTSGFLPLRWGNGMEGTTQGIEAWGDYDIADWWRISASYVWFDQDLGFKSGASGLLGVAQAGDDPAHRASLTSSMNVGRDFTIDASLRYMDELPDPQVPSYVELNGRIGWAINEHAELSLSGFNLLDERHVEFPGANASPREVLAELRVRY